MVFVCLVCQLWHSSRYSFVKPTFVVHDLQCSCQQMVPLELWISVAPPDFPCSGRVADKPSLLGVTICISD